MHVGFLGEEFDLRELRSMYVCVTTTGYLCDDTSAL